METELTELEDDDIQYYGPRISIKEIIDIFIAYDIGFIRNFGSDMFYVEMVDGEPMIPVHPMSAYPPGIEKLFDLMVREKLKMLSYKDEKLMKSRFSVNNIDL